MAIYFHDDNARKESWSFAFAEANAGTDIRYEGALGNLEDVEFAVVWAPPIGRLASFPNLKYIFSIAAGVTHITLDPSAPLHIPIVRLQDEIMALDMSCHILHWVLHFHRYYNRYKLYEGKQEWLRHKYPENSDRRVVILGVGQTGLVVCRHLVDLDFDVTGWSRSSKKIEGVTCFNGDAALPDVLAKADILVNLLPLTPATTDLINTNTLAQMPDGAFIINCSRGGTIVDADLLAALDSGKIEAVSLDVFRQEPLPADDPYWSHPKVSVTPHTAAPSNERSAAKFVADHIRRILDGGKPWPIVDLERGY
ncbi:MAG: glyoxylate/hydroxypyruvate reductase A [Rhodobacteraceae bacterium]|nr:glyoxylate/hydroxypyruvate reductase A [Paracoccaceae bacterium]